MQSACLLLKLPGEKRPGVRHYTNLKPEKRGRQQGVPFSGKPSGVAWRMSRVSPSAPWLSSIPRQQHDKRKEVRTTIYRINTGVVTLGESLAGRSREAEAR